MTETSDGSEPRRRLVLTVLDPPHAAGFKILPWPDEPHRGEGHTDFVCGRCGRLLVIGGSPVAFSNLLLSCACGALNRP